MNDDDKWKMFEQLVESNIPDPWLPIAKRIDILENAIYEQGIFLFGTKSPQVKKNLCNEAPKTDFCSQVTIE